MKNQLKKLLTLAVIGTSLLTLKPIDANAAWRQDSNGWWNTKDASWSVGWENINDKWYYFGGDGYMKTGWINDGGKWYYLDTNGAMVKNAIVDGYKLDENGTYTNEIQIPPIVNAPIVNQPTEAKVEETPTVTEEPKKSSNSKKRHRSSSAPSKSTTPAGAEVIVDEGVPFTAFYEKDTLKVVGLIKGKIDYNYFVSMPIEDAKAKYGVIYTNASEFSMESMAKVIERSKKFKVVMVGDVATLIKED